MEGNIAVTAEHVSWWLERSDSQSSLGLLFFPLASSMNLCFTPKMQKKGCWSDQGDEKPDT